MKRVLFRIFLLCTILTLFVACGSDAEPEEPAGPAEVEVTTPTPAPAPVTPAPVVSEPANDWVAINAGKISAVTEARNAAIATGANYCFEEYFDGVDAAYAEELAAYKAGGDPEKFSKTADEYVVLYNTFANLGKAQADCSYAYRLGYDEYDEKNMARGEALFEEVEALAANKPLDSNALFAKSKELADVYALAVSNGKMIDNIVNTYLAAEEAGAAELFPGVFEEVADMGYEALVFYNTEGTQEQLEADADNLLAVCNAFVAACDANAAYDEIYDNGFDVYDYKNIALGDAATDALAAVVEECNATGVVDGAKLYASAAAVRDYYKQSLANGYAVELLLASRDEAIAVGADELYPVEFAYVDEASEDSLVYFNEGGSQAELDADFANFDALYKSFIKAVELEDAYSYIFANGFDKYDVKNFDAANAAVDEVYSIADESLDGAAISAKLEEADAYLTKVISNGHNINFVYSLRENAISYGAYDYYPDEFDGVDTFAVSIVDSYNADGTQEELDADIESCSFLYNALMTAVDVANAYDYIYENGYNEIDSKDIAAGDAVVDEVYELAAAPELDGETIFEKVNVALDCYSQVIINCEKILAVADIRDEAIAAGAAEFFPVELDAADALAEESIAHFNADGTQEELDADIDNFENVYTAFLTACEAKDAYDEVIENGYDELDTKNFAAGNKAYEEAKEIANTTLNGADFLEKTTDAKFYYNKILDNVDMCLEVLATRDEAIAAGAEDYFPEEFAMVDDLMYEAVDYYNAEGTQEELDADAENFKNIYVAFIVAVNAQDAYDSIIEQGYDLYDQKNFEAGNEADEKVGELAYSTPISGKAVLDAVHEVDDAYNQVIDNGQMIDGVIAIREEAVAAGADEYFPEELAYADECAVDAVVYYNEQGTQEELEADVENFTYVYKAFYEASEAANVYIRIVENDFQSYDRNGFAAAEKATDELEDLAYSDADGKALYTKAAEVHAAYNKVVANAFKKKSDAVRSEYLAIKKDADGIKANVADKQGYAGAETRMKNAEAIFARMSYEAAFSEYSAAKEAMSSVYESVLEKRNAAIEALERGRARAEELSILAAQADIIAPLSNN